MKVQYIVIHCAATPPSSDIGVSEIDRWHKKRGWSRIGYHYVIRRSGEIEKGRPDDQAGAHVAGYNGRSLGVCLVGGLDDKGKPSPLFTSEQAASLAKLLMELTSTHPAAKVLGHRDFPKVNKACPSFDVGRWWSSAKSGKDLPAFE